MFIRRSRAPRGDRRSPRACRGVRGAPLRRRARARRSPRGRRRGPARAAFRSACSKGSGRTAPASAERMCAAYPQQPVAMAGRPATRASQEHRAAGCSLRAGWIRRSAPWRSAATSSRGPSTCTRSSIPSRPARALTGDGSSAPAIINRAGRGPFASAASARSERSTPFLAKSLPSWRSSASSSPAPNSARTRARSTPASGPGHRSRSTPGERTRKRSGAVP